MKAEYLVFRGGSWSNVVAANLAARARYWLAPSNRIVDLGFRCCAPNSISSNRVFRGGGWSSGAAHCRAAYRTYDGGPGYRFGHLGFRCLRRD